MRSSILSDLGIDLPEIRSIKVLGLSPSFSAGEVEKIHRELFIDAIVEIGSHEKSLDYFAISESFTHAIQVSFLPGVTDNVARSTAEAIEYLIDRKTDDDHVYFARVYLLDARGLNDSQIKHLCDEVLHNNLIEKLDILSADDHKTGKPFPEFPVPSAAETPETQTIDILDCSAEELGQLSKDMGLALSVEEMLAIQSHYNSPDQKSDRQQRGLPENPTDVEIEAIAQTWSEHCKHKIFAATIHYEDEKGEKNTIDSLFKTMIYKPTAEIMKERPEISSVFSDNAGAFHFDEDHDICIKAETHNSPSALDPYGGAMTGIVGVNRDVLGMGRGFLPIFNTDIFCFGPPDHSEPLPGGLHHPKRIFRGVHRGVKDGGNESGIPTVNGSISFDQRFIGKPLVFCGTGGLAPRELKGRPIVEKWIYPGDRIVMIGGRIGKDGIHGATFSSEGLSSSSPTSAVQIGDPITQKRMTDFVIMARDLGYYNFITDNGAGGLSSSIGEMAENSGGASLDLAKAPLKYAGLAPWEIFLSEAQERMSLAIPPDKIDDFLALAEKMHVTACDLGEFTNTGKLELSYNEKLVACLDMEFLHNGLPKMELTARWTPSANKELDDTELPSLNQKLCEAILSRYNICSKEDWVRQYDHEVQGMSVIKPFQGVERDAPSDAAVIRPLHNSQKGLAVSHGLLPRYSDIDAYHMVANCMDEALRSLVCTGADPSTAIGLDNFCWPDPVASPKNPEGEHKLAQLVRANMALRDYALAYRMPCISGKDSMKNDYVSDELRISIPPTLLFTALATLPDLNKAISMDFKAPGHSIYLIGETHDELGGSELYDHLGLRGQNIPVVDAGQAMTLYQLFHQASLKGWVRSAHDLSEGGLLVALAESCFGGRCGVKINTASLMTELSPTRFFFSESASRLLVSVEAGSEENFLKLFENQPLIKLGATQEAYQLDIDDLQMDLNALYDAWRSPLEDMV